MKSYLKKQRLLKLASIAFTMSFGVLAAPSTFANIINGGFEQPNISNGTWNNFTSIPGWTLSFGPEVDIVNHLPGLGIPYEGQNFIELDSSASSGIYQDVSTKPGQCYTLKFAISPRPKIPAADHKLRVLWNGSILDDLSAGAGGNSTSWSVYTYTVYASAGSTTRLEFQDTGPSNSYGMFLDAVSLENCDFEPCTANATKVYEPKKAKPSANMLAAYPDKKFKGFGDTRDNHFFGHTFTNLNIPGKTIVGATLEIKAKAGRSSLSTNDSLHFKFYGPSGGSLSTGWGTRFGLDNPHSGLLPQQWIIIFFPNGQTFNLNLANLKNLGTAPNAGVSIINELNTHGFLDFFVEDDTTVESVKLTVHYKCKFDVWVRDGIYDTGAEPSPNPPGNACSGWWCSRDIVMTNNSVVTAPSPTLPTHQRLVLGTTNYINALIRNKGPINAHNVNVEFYTHYSGTSGPWTFVGSTPISNLAVNGTYLASIPWNVPSFSSGNIGQHYCVQVRLKTPIDPSIGIDKRTNNNIAQRNLETINLRDKKPTIVGLNVLTMQETGKLELVFETTNEKGETIALSKELTNVTLGGLENLSLKDPKGLEIIDGKEAKLTGDKGSIVIEVKKGEELKLNLTFAPTALTQKDLSGKVYFHVKQFEGEELIGGVSYELRPPEEQLSVSLDSFTANAADGKVTINWTTGTETDNAGFTLWRATPIDGQCSTDPYNYKDVKQVQPLVYSKSQDGVLGASYSEVDQNVEPKVTYCYGLEDIEYNGKRQFHVDKIISATLN